MNRVDEPAVAIGLLLLLVIVIGVFVAALRRAGDWNTTPAPILPPDRSQWPPVMTRSYRGNRATALQAFGAEYAQLAKDGYAPVSEDYAEGSWGCGAFALGAAAILLFGFGLLILAYLVIVKPAGTLTVTYQLQAPPQPASPSFQRF